MPTDGSGSAAGVTAAGGVRWERFLPKMAVRVLLVEPDDSTRQIIAALLRKCSYRVAAVSDGLKAWKVLKGSTCNIDLILTEVELPSISGYALLTLIMEQEACKNIPVIMMSSQHSVGAVYKYMLKGATDLLVKPVHKNELRKLWQHVWLKRASNTAAGLGSPDENVQQMDENTSEKFNVMSNHSSGYIPCIQKNKGCTEKGSDGQSSCTKPVESGAEGENSLCQPNSDKCISDGQESMDKRAHEDDTRDAENTRVLDNTSREAIDLIGAFGNNLEGAFGSSDPNISAGMYEILPFLDLSLRRPHSSGSRNQINDENPGMNHSDASAFSQYSNRPVRISKPTSPVPCSKYNQKYEETNCKKRPYNYAPDTLQTRHPEFSLPQSSLPHFSLFYTSNLQKNSNSTSQKDGRLENMEDGCGNRNSCTGDKICGESLHVQDGVMQRSMQREAALNKFRMKRKDRCFNKKVRYESRRKLAEQRPRVKGQFVRQALNDNRPGNSAAGNWQKT